MISLIFSIAVTLVVAQTSTKKWEGATQSGQELIQKEGEQQ